MKKLTVIMASVLMLPLLAFGASIFASQPASAQVSEGVRGGVDSTNTGNVPTNITEEDGLVKRAVNVLLWVIGIVSVVMIILGGIRYAMSSGDSARAKSAMNTILYAVIGLVIAIFAYAIVNFVLEQITN